MSTLELFWGVIAMRRHPTSKCKNSAFSYGVVSISLKRADVKNDFGFCQKRNNEHQ